jgi:hypothetical protein
MTKSVRRTPETTRSAMTGAEVHEYLDPPNWSPRRRVTIAGRKTSVPHGSKEERRCRNRMGGGVPVGGSFNQIMTIPSVAIPGGKLIQKLLKEEIRRRLWRG